LNILLLLVAVAEQVGMGILELAEVAQEDY
jgi:hypothetical protein